MFGGDGNLAGPNGEGLARAILYSSAFYKMSLFEGLFAVTGSKSSLFDTKSAFFAATAADVVPTDDSKPINKKKRKERDAPVAADEPEKKEPKTKKTSIKKEKTEVKAEKIVKTKRHADVAAAEEPKKSKESMQAQISKVSLLAYVILLLVLIVL